MLTSFIIQFSLAVYPTLAVVFDDRKPPLRIKYRIETTHFPLYIYPVSSKSIQHLSTNIVVIKNIKLPYTAILYKEIRTLMQYLLWMPVTFAVKILNEFVETLCYQLFDSFDALTLQTVKTSIL